jgi:hypothetical protein
VSLVHRMGMFPWLGAICSSHVLESNTGLVPKQRIRNDAPRPNVYVNAYRARVSYLPHLT